MGEQFLDGVGDPRTGLALQEVEAEVESGGDPGAGDEVAVVFREQTGTTPLQWLHRARIRQAQHLLETTDHSVERIGAQAGFGSPTAFRDRFRRTTGVSPRTYRRTFA